MGAVLIGLVLAAGKSTRMGRPKPLLRLPDGRPFVVGVVDAFRAAGLDEVVVVVGHEAARVTMALAGLERPVRVVVNDHYESGQLSSLLAGLDEVDRPGVAAVLVTLVDVPFVSPATVRSVAERYRATHAPVVRPTHRGRHGHPVCLDRSIWPALRRADPQTGIKPVVRAHASAAGDVPVSDEGAFVDVDTPDEYTRLTERHP